MSHRRSGRLESDHLDVGYAGQLLIYRACRRLFSLDRFKDWPQPSISINANFPSMNNNLNTVTPACVHKTPCALSKRIANLYLSVGMEVTPWN